MVSEAAPLKNHSVHEVCKGGAASLRGSIPQQGTIEATRGHLDGDALEFPLPAVAPSQARGPELLLMGGLFIMVVLMHCWGAPFPRTKRCRFHCFLNTNLAQEISLSLRLTGVLALDRLSSLNISSVVLAAKSFVFARIHRTAAFRSTVPSAGICFPAHPAIADGRTAP